MKFSELTVLLPCHSLEDFPIYHEGAAANELLGAWCAAWHPALIADAGLLPEWQRIDIPPEDLSGRLLVVPHFCLDQLPAGYTTRAENEGAWFVAVEDADAASHQAVLGLDAVAPLDDQLVIDFRALGFCRLQMELLTRQMRYSVNIDEVHFKNQAVAAAQAAIIGDLTAANQALQQCFDTLYEARKHFYPVDVYLLDVTLLASTTLGASLEAELASGAPLNLLGSGEVLEALSNEHGETWSRLLKQIDHGKTCVLGSDDVESELPLLPLEGALDHLRAGALKYEKLLGRPPVVYGRRRAGLWPVMPQLLAKLGYQGSLHFTLDDGKFPLGPQVKVRWEGIESSVIDILARLPADAAKPETFLALSRLLSDSMDSDHVATVAFAHWPGLTSPWYQILRRIAELSPVLGKFLLLDEYFMHTDMPGRLSKFTADDYRTPYLKQAIIRRQQDPISTIAQAHQQAASNLALGAMQTVCRSVGKPDSQINDLSDGLHQLGDLLPRGSESPATRCLLFNPQLGTRRLTVEIPDWRTAPTVGGAVVAASVSDNRAYALVDVPSMGFAWIEPGRELPPNSRESKIVEGQTLRNEHLEVRISSKTGGIQGLFNYRQRGNQLSQQLAMRSGSAGSPQYSTMRAESVEVTVNCATYGEIVSRGVLIDAADKTVARFQQRVGLWAGSRTVDLEIELSDVDEPRADPWNSYIAARFAWPDEMAELYRGVSMARQKTTANRIEAPEFIDIDNGAATVSLLTGGLAYHRRSDTRMLDTLLVVRGETARSFRLAFGVDLPHPAATVVDHLLPKLQACQTIAPPANSTGWFFHVGAKNIVATHWAPIVDTSEEGSTPVVKGFRVRLMEVGGTAGRVPLRAYREIQYARQIDFVGETILELYVDDDKIMLDFGPHELLEVEALWIR